MEHDQVTCMSCDECGREFATVKYWKYAPYYIPPYVHSKTENRIKKLFGLDKKGDKVYFCSDGCMASYELRHKEDYDETERQIALYNTAEILKEKTSSKMHLRTIAVLCACFGLLGVHRFAVRKIGTGLMMFCLFLAALLSIFSGDKTNAYLFFFLDGIWWLHDLFLVVFRKFRDKDWHIIDK